MCIRDRPDIIPKQEGRILFKNSRKSLNKLYVYKKLLKSEGNWQYLRFLSQNAKTHSNAFLAYHQTLEGLSST